MRVWCAFLQLLRQKFSANFQTSNFPFDVQSCALCFTLNGYDVDDFTFNATLDNGALAQVIEMLYWSVPWMMLSLSSLEDLARDIFSHCAAIGMSPSEISSKIGNIEDMSEWRVHISSTTSSFNYCANKLCQNIVSIIVKNPSLHSLPLSQWGESTRNGETVWLLFEMLFIAAPLHDNSRTQSSVLDRACHYSGQLLFLDKSKY